MSKRNRFIFPVLSMDGLRSLSYSMIFEVLATLSNGPLPLSELSRACKVQQVYLRTLIPSAISSGLVEQKSGVLQLTKKGARTAIYILIINDGMNYNTGDYRDIMRALDKTLESEVQV